MLEAVHLTKRYSSVPAVQDLSFSLRSGQILGCLGPNGSGKSTTVKMLTGLLEPTRGAVLYNGQRIREDLARYREHLGYVPEEPHLYPYLTGWEYLELVGTLRQVPRHKLEAVRPNDMHLISLLNETSGSALELDDGRWQQPALDQPCAGWRFAQRMVDRQLCFGVGDDLNDDLSGLARRHVRQFLSNLAVPASMDQDGGTSRDLADRQLPLAKGTAAEIEFWRIDEPLGIQPRVQPIASKVPAVDPHGYQMNVVRRRA